MLRKALAGSEEEKTSSTAKTTYQGGIRSPILMSRHRGKETARSRNPLILLIKRDLGKELRRTLHLALSTSLRLIRTTKSGLLMQSLGPIPR